MRLDQMLIVAKTNGFIELLIFLLLIVFHRAWDCKVSEDAWMIDTSLMA